MKRRNERRLRLLMKDKIFEFAYAKINPYLDIVSRRADGFHDIVSYMLTVSLCDRIELIRKASEIAVKGNDAVPEKDDLMYRAAELFFAVTEIRGGVLINAEKVIPMQAGLAGGSADAAAVLRGLNRLYGTGMSCGELEALGARLGSDVPFCVVGGARLARGKGDMLSDAPLFPDCRIVVAAGKENASTPRQFALLDRLFGNFESRQSDTGRLDSFLASVGTGELRGIVGTMYNIFEEIGSRDEAATEIMRSNGAVGCLMCGSGSAVFGLFNDVNASRAACEALALAGYKAFDTSPIYKFKKEETN